MATYGFIDTNIFVYTFDQGDPVKQARAQALVGNALTAQNDCISYQVIQEFLNVATRKFKNRLTHADAKKYLTLVLQPLCRVYPNGALFSEALDIANRWQYSFYDSLILAAAKQAGADVLYSEDLQHGQMIGRVRIVNPFV